MQHTAWPWAVNCGRCLRDLKDDELAESCPGCGARRQRSRVDLTFLTSGSTVQARSFLLALDPFYNQRTIPDQFLRLAVHAAGESIIERAEVVDAQGRAVSERSVVVDLLKSSGIAAR